MNHKRILRAALSNIEDKYFHLLRRGYKEWSFLYNLNWLLEDSIDDFGEDFWSADLSALDTPNKDTRPFPDISWEDWYNM